MEPYIFQLSWHNNGGPLWSSTSMIASCSPAQRSYNGIPCVYRRVARPQGSSGCGRLISGRTYHLACRNMLRAFKVIIRYHTSKVWAWFFFLSFFFCDRARRTVSRCFGCTYLSLVENLSFFLIKMECHSQTENSW